jgi:hypothetical protein
MEVIKTVQDFKKFIKENHDLLYQNAIRVEDISKDDEIMLEDEWDEIYQHEVIDGGKI